MTIDFGFPTHVEGAILPKRNGSDRRFARGAEDALRLLRCIGTFRQIRLLGSEFHCKGQACVGSAFFAICFGEQFLNL